MKMCKKGQGATEYLLMLAAVLVIVAIAVYYVTSAGGGPTLSFTAENNGTSTVLTFKTGTSTVTQSWQYAKVSGGTQDSWNTCDNDISAGTTITLSYDTADGDTFKIKIGTSVYEATVQPYSG